MATLFIGQNRVFLPETHSTNSYATELLKNVNVIEGTAVYTHHQTNGKGQRGNTWIAEPERNATFSLILKPTFLSSKNAFYLSKITALALHDVLTEILNAGQFDIKIKWPNDILVNQKKIAGVLIENSMNETLNWSVIGIGLNVNQNDFGAITTATSLKLLNYKDYSVENSMEAVFKHLEKWYLRLKKQDFKFINEAYHQHLFGIHETREFEQKGVYFNATIEGVNETGLLMLRLNDSVVRAYDIKELNFIY